MTNLLFMFHFFFNNTATTDIYTYLHTLSLHDALPISTTTHRLSDLQLVLLATAARRENGSLLPPPDTLTHPRAVLAKAITALIRRKLAAEVDLEEPGTEQRTLDDRCWRQKGARLLGVVITDARSEEHTSELQSTNAHI